ncbi:DUF1853 family protein [Marinobacter sp. VGCF2001]|uniref:DUF1853 family protein n=1 Tax=Marinobacter sp. VGCF2001 TaxID=3417189 RepID=UPI003CF10B2A
MTKNEMIETLLAFKIPAVRHLAWLCLAPQLLRHEFSFNPSAHLAPGFLTMLKEWEKNPEALPPRLAESPERRLGHYVERLYEVLLRDLLGWDIILQNQQIRAGDRTLGELDFLVRNRESGQLEHHEIAIKFYLGFRGEESQTRWFGPNARDRLDLKTDRLVNHQSQLCRRPETLDLLASLGICEPIVPRIFMPGYLFYPDEQTVPAPPAQAPASHLRGRWLWVDEARQQNRTCWVPLDKPNWIGPWAQPQAPDVSLGKRALERVEALGTPQLFAILGECEDSGSWVEKDRVFVMPLPWPKVAD